jgi:hypothetical protein
MAKSAARGANNRLAARDTQIHVASQSRPPKIQHTIARAAVADNPQFEHVTDTGAAAGIRRCFVISCCKISSLMIR